MTLRGWITVILLGASLALNLGAAAARLPDYRLGDVAAEDIVTPVPLLVVNPAATDALRQKVSQQVYFIVRHTPQNAAEAERELRESVTTARKHFLAALQRGLEGREPQYSDLDTPAFAAAIRDASRELPKDLPLDHLAAIWVRGLSDETMIETLLQPLRQVMAQPIVGTKTDTPMPTNQPVRVVRVAASGEPPAGSDLDSGGTVMPASKVLSLWRARRLVETHFPSTQQEFGRFAASFVRANAQPDAALTGIARARRMEGVTVNDTYEAAEVIVRKGQTIDPKALSALAVLREKSMIGTLQTKLEQEQSVAGQISRQTQWTVATLAGVCVTFFVVVWRLRSRPGAALVALPAGAGLARASELAVQDSTDNAWRDRALAAEHKVERAQAAIRSGALGWMREKIFRTMFRHRAELLSTQQKAEAEMLALEQRLEQLHTPLQERISAYEKRIEELEQELAAKGEENRELLDARISLARQQLKTERERGRFEAN